MICNVKKEKNFFLNSMEMVFRGGGFSPCTQSHHKTEEACMGFRFREGGVGGGEGENCSNWKWRLMANISSLQNFG